MNDDVNVTWLILVLPYFSLLLIIYGHITLGNYFGTLP